MPDRLFFAQTWLTIDAMRLGISTRLKSFLFTIAASSTLLAADQEDRTLAQLGRVNPELAVAWNLAIHEIGYAEAFPFPKALRAHAMAHIAIHDALNAVIPHYRQYAYVGRDPGAHPIAAAAQAAHDVAVS